MDFSHTDEQQAIAELALQIFRDGATQERMRALERGDGPRFDADLWKQAADAGLLGIAVPEAHGGAGLGFVEVASVVEALGRTAAPIPWLETVVLGALPIAEFGSEAQQSAFLPRVVEGECILTAALTEAQADTSQPLTQATRDGDGWRLDGEKICVPAGQLAERILVPARSAGRDHDEVLMFLLDPRTAGASLDPLITTSGKPEANLRLENVRVEADDRLGADGQGAEILAWIALRATACLSALALGGCAEALSLTAEYVKTRKQFGQPLAMFQAVGQRIADAYVDVEGIRLTSWQATWRISAGLPAQTEVAVAKFWAADAGQRVVHAAQHLHGGIGVDRDYPLHRYFLAAKELELSLGGGTRQLLTIGKMLAETPA